MGLSDKLKEKPAFAKSEPLDCCPQLLAIAGEPLFIRMMSGTHRRDYDRMTLEAGESAKGSNVKSMEVYHDIRLYLICRTLINEAGVRQFEDGEESLISDDLDYVEIVAISDAAMIFNKLRTADVEAEVKNLESAPPTDS